MLGGWASGSPYPLLGGIRASAQLISYEVSMGLSLISVFILAGTMSTSEIVNAQASGTEVFGVAVPSWYVILLLPSFLIFLISVVGETNRAPFDLPEAESELVAGFMTEYSSLRFALYMLAEYVHMVVASSVVVTLFLGGWRAPWPISIWEGANEGWLPLLWFMGKVTLMLFFFVWLRGTLPRLRYDQFMRLGWKLLIPLNLVWIVALAGIRVTQVADVTTTQRWLIIGSIAAGVLLTVLFWPQKRGAAPLTAQERVAARPEGSFPVPPLDLEVPPSPRARAEIAGKREAAPAESTSAGAEGGN